MIDPSIALSVKPPQFESPIDQYAKLASLQNMMQQQRLGAAQLQAAGLENQQRQYDLNAQQAQNDAFKGAMSTDANTGMPTFNRQAVTDYLSKAGFGSKVPSLMKGFLELDQTAEGLKKTRGENGVAESDYAGAIGAQARKANYDPGVLSLGLQHAAALGYQSASQALAALSQDPSKAQAIADTLIAGSPKQRELQAKDDEAQGALMKGRAATGELDLKQFQQDLQTSAKQLANAGSQEAYDQIRGGLPKRIADKFPDTYNQNAVLAVGANPGEVLTAAQTAKRDIETARHNKVDEATANVNANANVRRTNLEYLQAGMDPSGKPMAATPLADAIYAGKIAPETARDYIRRQPGLLQQIVNAHPDFDEASIDRRFAFNKRLSDYGPTEIGGQSLALNKLVHHADLLYSMIDNLNNGSFGPKNQLYNSIATAFGKAPEGDFNTVRDFVTHEAAKFAQGGAPNEADIKEEVKNFSSAKDPNALKSHLNRLLQIAGGGMNALNEQGRQAGMGAGFTVLGDEGAQILQKRGFDPTTFKPAQKQPQAAAPAPVAATAASPQPSRSAGAGIKLPTGAVPVTAGGRTYWFPNQAAADVFKAKAGIK